MKILAFDGTAKVATVAVSEDGRILASYSIDNGLTQSELLLPMAENMLSSLGMTFDDIDAFATSVGPGSFTGVRIGVSLVKGLAFGKNKPCVEVSTLEALAENLRGIDGVVVPVMDARRAQVYSATYVSTSEGLVETVGDRAVSIAELGEELRTVTDKKIYLVGDGYAVAKKTLTACGVHVEETPEILINENAASVARVAERKIARGDTVTDLEIAPVYLRMPQAERERLERLNNS